MKKHSKIFQFTAIIYSQKYLSFNPKLQATVSRDYLVYSAADIIAHSIEAYFTAEYRPEIY